MTNDTKLVTFADAEQRNAYALLVELYDHAMSPDDDAQHHLTELALSAAVVSWWSHWQPNTMHRAFLAGASLADVAAAAGGTEDDVYDRWSTWVAAQVQLWVRHGLGVHPAQADAVRARIRPQA